MGGSPEYAPKALYDLFDLIHAKIPSAQMGGIRGDVAHTYGYHRARNVLPASDYSVCQSKLDREGDGWACAALDVTLGSGDVMHTVSRRLLAAKNDPRMKPVREFFGSIDGRNVIGWDWLRNTSTTSSDMSHLWHIHLSIHRKYADDLDALRGVAEVMAGTNGDDDLSEETVIAALRSKEGQELLAKAATQGGKAFFHARNPKTGEIGQYGLDTIVAWRLGPVVDAYQRIEAKIAAVQSAVERLKPSAVVTDTKAIVSGVTAGIKAMTWGVK